MTQARTSTSRLKAGNSPNGRARSRPGADGILAAALQTFYEIGYGGASVRTIASRANVSVAALYHHFPSKHDILVVIMRQVLDDVLANAEDALAHCGTDPAEQFRAIVGAHVRYHTEHPAEAFVANSELRSLEPQSRQQILALRDRYESLFADVITRGVDQGIFHVEDPKPAARAVLAMCTAIFSWFRTGGPLSAQAVQQQSVDLSLNTVGYRLNETPHGPPQGAPSAPAVLGGHD